MKPTYEAAGVRLYLGDSAAILPALTDKFDLLATDPPYGMAYQSCWGNQDDRYAGVERVVASCAKCLPLWRRTEETHKDERERESELGARKGV